MDWEKKQNPIGVRKKGRLKIFLGYAAGVGKTYSMLDNGTEKLKSGVDTVVGFVDQGSGQETLSLLERLPILPLKSISHGKLQRREFDVDAALERKPELILVDDLAYTNPPEMRNLKRYQDIEELLNAGIDVYTTLNIQNIEGLSSIVQSIIKVSPGKTIPDYIFDQADMIETIDFAPEELMKRLEEGKISRHAKSGNTMKYIFTKENLRLLRELTMRKAADRLSNDNQRGVPTRDSLVRTKFLVVISDGVPSPNSIRWTAKAADVFHASWTTVHVDSLRRNHENEVQDQLDLAKKLGSETVRLNGHDAAAVIAEYARVSGISNIVIGKVRNQRSIKRLFERELEDELFALLPNVELHIIPESFPMKHRKLRKLKLTENIVLSWGDTMKTLGILALATLLSKGINTFIYDDQNVITVYILSVMIISRITNGYFYGMTASFLSVLLFNFFFTIPYYTFAALQPEYPVTFMIMFIAAFLISTLTMQIKTQVKISAEREHRTKLLYEINKKLLQTRGLESIVKLTSEYITQIFDRAVVIYTEDPVNPASGYYMESSTDPYTAQLRREEEREAAHWVYLNKKKAGAGTETLMNAGAHYMPILSQGKPLGVVGISCANGKLDQNSIMLLRMLVSQVAMALERQFLSDEQRRILLDSETEKMRSNLLRAISHDIRTPLTGILGASSVILEAGETLDQVTHDQLLSNIKEDSQWLIRMVENLLSVTRINEGTMNVAKSPEAVEEIAAEAVSHVRKRISDRKITVKVPDELLMVPMDGMLIEQVLINLLENAIKYSSVETTVELEVFSKGQFAVFEVRDFGKGISEGDLGNLFVTRLPDNGHSTDSSRGMGIGLSICRSIIKAHGGKMEAANREAGGAVFRFLLPLEGAQDES
ncbi:sensor histidine kinase KdpD [Anoxybacterium hadale]|uniref:Sensor histidine kinase KdpD n=1 Tax=Anoxybacterium hadale TaxID=3408580 RepID=A0ACD1A7S8_9FIRM|nr:sensor histidine kinase KdpD [Clostridiales bacterium]